MPSTITPMELARVREVEILDDESMNARGYRVFMVRNDGTDCESRVLYFAASDQLRCRRHQSFDNCTCTARVRLSGAI